METFEAVTLANSFSGGSFDEGWGLDTGFYVVGRLMARFVIRIVGAATNRLTPGLNVWENILARLLEPLQEMDDYDNAWAMEGEIYGPGNATGHTDTAEDAEERRREAVARWQIWMGDLDEYD